MYFFLLSCFGAAAQWQHVCTSQYLKLFKIFVLFIWTVICCQSGNASLFTTAAVRQDRESSGSGLWERELLTLFWAERSHLPPRWNFWPRRWSMLVFCCSRTPLAPRLHVSQNIRPNWCLLLWKHLVAQTVLSDAVETGWVDIFVTSAAQLLLMSP